MAKTVFRNKGVTFISVEADSKSVFPSLCQILKTLCCSVEWCSVLEGLTQSTAALGTIQIMVGLFNIGLGPGRISTNPGDLTSLGAAYWLGAVFIVTGIMSILAGQFPSRCLVGFTVFMNIAGAILAITGIALYAIDLGNASLLWLCERSRNSADYFGDSCRDVALVAQGLLRSMDITLIAMAVLQLCVSIRLAVLGIKSLTSGTKKEEGSKDVDVVVTGPAAENCFN
ncbi:membrane-spanning 4-domains subfamily A member 4A-like [Pempheris klunzingeri]|uniref:membrane-spanning 4-domains subfamily A member 4A-like n=1 Tax=Pempheris klunzingeri TaxID=3127111 RepID=UPI00398170CE